MFRKKETQTARVYFWNDFSTPISSIKIQLLDEKRTTLAAGQTSDDKHAPYPLATKVLVTRNPNNGDLRLEYFQDDKELAQEIISGHFVSKVEVEFPVN